MPATIDELNVLTRSEVVSFVGTLVYHLATAILARMLALPDRPAATVSELGVVLIALGLGLIAARASGTIWRGVLAGLAAGLAHGTLGWRISAAIRGGWLPGGADHEGAVLGFAIEWALYGTILGLVGASVAHMLPDRARPAP